MWSQLEKIQFGPAWTDNLLLISICFALVLQEGDKIDVKGPYGKFTYEGLGQYNLNRWV